ncbi:MAG: FMN-binding negative transcriptional regulator [Planktotalea sp.]|uniref:FMN-binding negative transcriptional regulator n=1 Tax=Planktotalea sp. TaxID=2029877 RepID=UPI003C77A74F
MHPNPIFRTTDAKHSLAFARERSFGTLLINAEPTPLIAHVPFLLSEDADFAGLHLVRSNPIARALKNGAMPAKLSVMGPDSYISPDWYEVADQVPTWNYVAVHFEGTLELMPDDTLRDLIAYQSAHFEQRLTPKQPWIAEKMSDGVLEKMMRAISPVRLTITEMQSTWKLGQNKPEPVRRAAAKQVAKNGIGHETQSLAALMDSPPKPDQQE